MRRESEVCSKSCSLVVEKSMYQLLLRVMVSKLVLRV